MVTSWGTVLITIFFVMLFTESIHSKLSKRVARCKMNIYQEYELRDGERHAKKIILEKSLKFKLWTNLRSDEAKVYYLEVYNFVEACYDMFNPKQFCGIHTQGKIDYWKQPFEEYTTDYLVCIHRLKQFFLESDNATAVLKDVYLYRVQSHFKDLDDSDLAKKYFNHMTEKIDFNGTLEGLLSPLNFCETKEKQEKDPNYVYTNKKRKNTDSGEEPQSSIPKLS